MKRYSEKVSLIGICMLLWVAYLFAQAPDTLWTRTYGGSGNEEGRSVQQTTDGGYIIAGYTSSFGAGGYDVYIIKTDANGDTLWTKTYGGPSDDRGYSVDTTITDGGYIVTGYTGSSGTGDDVWLLKTDENGDTLWTKTYGGAGWEEGRSVQQTTDGGYIIAGCTSSFGAGGYDVYIIKTDANGDTLWTKTYGDTLEDHGYSVQQTVNGGYIATGYITEFEWWRREEFYLIKTDSIGDTLWTRESGGDGDDMAYSVQQTSDSGFIQAGYTDIEDEVFCVSLVKSNENGGSSWASIYRPDNNNCKSYSVQQTYDGRYIVAGEVQCEGKDVLLMRIDTDGKLIWSTNYGGTSDDCGYSIEQTSDGGYIIAGYTSSFGTGGKDVYIIKTKPEYTYLPAEIDINPDVLNLKSKGKWITCYIELPEDYSVEDIDKSTVAITKINGESIEPIYSENHPSGIGDYDNDGIPDLMVKFDRNDLIETLLEKITPPTNVELTISGELTDDTPFEGCDTIYVIRPGGPQTAGEIPYSFVLYENYPDPFSSSTIIRYALPADAQVELDIYDVGGRVVKTLVNDVIKIGYHKVSWDGTDVANRKLPSGIYFVKFEAGDYSATEKLLLIR